MKNTALILLTVLSLCLACRKPAEEIEQKRYPVTFHVSNFVTKPGTTTFNSDSLLLADISSHIFDSEGRYIESTPSNGSTQGSFKNLKVFLPTGTYTIVFASFGAYTSIGMKSVSKYIPSGYEVFSQKAEFSVGIDNPPINITLERMNSAFEVRFLDDDFPEKVNFLWFIYQDNTYFNFGSQQGFESRETWRRFADSIDFTSYSTNLLNTDITSITVVARTATKSVGRALPIKCYRNRKTVLTGYIFDTKDFKVSIDTLWDANADTVKF